MNQNLSSRLFWPDLIRALAVTLVLFVHISGGILNDGYFGIQPVYWWFAAVINGLGRLGVPLFFMLSGALILDKKTEPVSLFFKKRMTRIGIAFLVWSLFYAACNSWFYNKEFTVGTMLQIFSKSQFYHLWYFYSIIGLYLLAPVLRYLDKKGLRYASLLWLATIPLYFMENKFIHFPISGNFINVLPFYLGFFTGGALLKDSILSRKGVVIAAIVFTVVFILTVAATGLFTISNAGKLDGYFFNYVNPTIVTCSIAVFLIIRSSAAGMQTQNGCAAVLFRKAVTLISACSLGIFAIHPFFIEAFKIGKFGFHLTIRSMNPLAGIPVMVIIAGMLSLITAYLISKIPLLRRAV